MRAGVASQFVKHKAAVEGHSMSACIEAKKANVRSKNSKDCPILMTPEPWTFEKKDIFEIGMQRAKPTNATEDFPESRTANNMRYAVRLCPTAK